MTGNYYEILGVGESASNDEIKKAYRSLSLKCHPDRNPNDESAKERFQKVSEAYESLSDEQARREYDMTRKGGASFFGIPQQGGAEMENLFSMLFGGGGGLPPGFAGGNIHIFPGSRMNFPSPGIPGFPQFMNQGLQKPMPIIKNVSVTMEQVFNGANLPAEVERWVMISGVKTVERETVYIPIPKGIDDGEIILLREKGNVITDSVKGDIKVFIKVEPHPNFQRKGLDLLTSQKISLKESRFGVDFEFFKMYGGG
jgi:DnaJ-class molecular chaperone